MENTDYLDVPIDEVLKSYKTFLSVKYPPHLVELKKREVSNSDGVKLEAAMFSVARHYRLTPKISEIIGEGGVDFLCSSDKYKFLLEVTHLDSASIEEKSGMANKLSTEGRAISMITNLLRSKASNKATQLSGHLVPRVLCIGASHIGSPIFMGKEAAEWLMTSDTKISVSIGKPNAEPKLITGLEKSVFFRFDSKGKIEPCRQSISAILLVILDANSCLIKGLLHPAPAIPFDISLFPDIHFLKVANWPCSEGQIITEWIIHCPPTKRVYLDRIEFETEELKSL